MIEKKTGSKKSSVPWFLDMAGGLAARHRATLVRLGNIESALVRPDIEDRVINRPVFICGLARSGSTILLEFLADHPDVVSHRYRDFPFVHLPVFWNVVTRFAPGGEKQERAHQDGLFVNSNSPESMDEPVWMSFFENLHTPFKNNILTAETRNPAFERFYREHIQKLLYARQGTRFVTKNNYNVTRIPYLKKIFPDARFVVPVRDPLSHVYSMVKQHRFFSRAQQDDPRGLRYMQRCGHFEFGQDFRPVHTGDDAAVAEILDLWQAGRDVQAYARYWAMMHRFILQVARAERACVHLVPYDDLCAQSHDTLAKIAGFIDLECAVDALDVWSARLSPPGYYTPSWSADDRAMVAGITAGIYEDLKGLS